MISLPRPADSSSKALPFPDASPVTIETDPELITEVREVD